ncbi:MAG: exosortase/archaeosortase family protein [Gammaproteobacteria bacterium]|nr:exosortase/archaeosortase family protein [Gammaproteobacteria bacterium]
MDQIESLEKDQDTFWNRFNRPQLVLFYASVVLIGLACFNQFEYLVSEYWFPEPRISKGPVIWLLALFVIHRDLSRGEFRGTTTNWDLVLIAAFVLLLAFGLAIDPLIAPTLLIVFAWYLGSSTRDYTRMLIIWLFLFFSLPFFSWVAPPFLQFLTTKVTENLLGIAGIPVLVQEFNIAIPGGQLYIDKGCGGFGFLANNLILCFLFSLLSRPNIRQFSLGILVTVLVSLIANWIRVAIIILIAHNLGIDHSYVADHDNLGLYVHAISLVPFFYLLLKIDKRGPRDIQIFKPVTKDMLAVPAMVLVVFPLLIVFSHQWLIKV